MTGLSVKRNERMGTKFIHTNIISKDWRTLAAFYVKVFDCKILQPERNLAGVWLEKGTGVQNAKIKGVHLQLPGFDENGPTLEIFQYEENEPGSFTFKANREGFRHIAFHVDNVKKVLDRILKFGGKRLGEIVKRDFPNGQLTFIYTTDPEGNIIEIQNWKSL